MATPEIDDDGPPGRAVLLAAAAFLLGLALHVRNGTLSTISVTLLTASFAATLWALSPPRRLDARAARIAIATAVGLGFVAHLLRAPATFIQPWDTVGARVPFGIGVSIAALTAILAVFFPERLTRTRLLVALGAFLFVGTWIIRHSPNPYIDVVLFHRDAIAALLAGENPYDITFPNIYPETSHFYGDGLVRDGRVQFGFLYPPLSLLMAVPGQWLLGDFRYSQLLATAGAGALLAGARRSALGFLAALLFLFYPRIFLVIEMGWTEPFVVLLFALTIFCACRWPRALPFALGLLLACKQYAVFLLPLVPLLVPAGRRLRTVLVAGAVAAAITLPFALWNFRALWFDVMVLQTLQPFRMDALSYLTGIARLTGFKAPALIGFIAAAGAIALCLRRCARTPSGFAHGAALTTFAFFAFNKQAFCNYYTAVLGCLCAALAAYRSTEEPRP